jgi:hypothetical protein
MRADSTLSGTRIPIFFFLQKRSTHVGVLVWKSQNIYRKVILSLKFVLEFSEFEKNKCSKIFFMETYSGKLLMNVDLGITRVLEDVQ